jgi:hypothetical protein
MKKIHMAILSITAALVILGMAVVVEIPNLPQAHADQGGIPNANAGVNPFKQKN